jgi:hypothetical protein
MKFARRRSGFAMVMAIFLMALSAMTLTALGVTLFTQARRTQMAAEDAQIRQLLMAGTVFAAEQVKSNSMGSVDVPLPDALREDSAKLTVDVEEGTASGERTAEVEASVPRYRSSEHLRLVLRAGGWEVVEANLGQ